jgi:hypothetical protein
MPPIVDQLAHLPMFRRSGAQGRDRRRIGAAPRFVAGVDQVEHFVAAVQVEEGQLVRTLQRADVDESALPLGFPGAGQLGRRAPGAAEAADRAARRLDPAQGHGGWSPAGRCSAGDRRVHRVRAHRSRTGPRRGRHRPPARSGPIGPLSSGVAPALPRWRRCRRPRSGRPDGPGPGCRSAAHVDRSGS